jgi:hypothetical protein
VPLPKRYSVEERRAWFFLMVELSENKWAADYWVSGIRKAESNRISKEAGNRFGIALRC